MDKLEIGQLSGGTLEDEPSEAPEGPEKQTKESSFSFKGRVIDDPKEIQSRLSQVEGLERLKGEMGNRLGQKDKEIQELRASMDELRSQVEKVNSPAPLQGEELIDLMVSDPQKAVDYITEQVTKDVTKRLSTETKGLEDKFDKRLTSSEASTKVQSFFSQHPEMRQYLSEQIGGKTLIDLARDDIIHRAKTDYSLQSQLADEASAFQLLADEVESLASRLGLKGSTPQKKKRDISERVTLRGGNSTSKEDPDFSHDDMRREMVAAIRKIGSRIKPSYS